MGQVSPVVLWFWSASIAADAQTISISRPEDMLATDRSRLLEWLETARPAPASEDERARALRSLPSEGEVTRLSGRARRKLAALDALLQRARRDSVYAVKIIGVPQAAVAIHARSVVVISEPALALLRPDELRALVAHEIGHEYLWAGYEEARQRDDRGRLRQLELLADGIALLALHGLGMDSLPLISGLEKVGRFNHERFGGAIKNVGTYPTIEQRRAFAHAVDASLRFSGDRARARLR